MFFSLSLPLSLPPSLKAMKKKKPLSEDKEKKLKNSVTLLWAIAHPCHLLDICRQLCHMENKSLSSTEGGKRGRPSREDQSSRPDRPPLVPSACGQQTQQDTIIPSFFHVSREDQNTHCR